MFSFHNFGRSTPSLIVWTVLVSAIPILFSACQQEQDPQSPPAGPTWHMAVGTYTQKEAHVNGRGRGVYVFRVDSLSGKISKHRVLNNLINPSYVAAHPRLPVAYAVNEHDLDGSGSITTMEIHQPLYRPELEDYYTAGGTFPCHISLDQSGELLFTSNYGSGNLSIYSLDDSSGMPSGSPTVIPFGNGNDKSHIHMALTDPDNRFVYVTDLGTDSIHYFRIDPNEKSLLKAGTVSSGNPGAGPRHMAFHPDQPYLYVCNEYRASVDVFERNPDDGSLTFQGEVGLAKAGTKREASGAHIRVHPSGRFLYATNRGNYDEVVAFRIDTATGMPTPIAIYSSGGDTPRHFTISPDGRFLYVANQDSNTIRSFAIDLGTGELRLLNEILRTLTPVCLTFLPNWQVPAQ